MESTLVNLWQWLSPCLTPLSQSPCGHDPRYDDDFATIREEIEKLSHCDFLLIKELSHKLFSEHYKDLRLAGYLTLALVHQHQIIGLLVGLKFYKCLLEQFANQIHPLSNNGRKAAIAWMNNPRFIAFLPQTIATRNEKQAVFQAITELNTTIKSCLGDIFPLVYGLDTWLNAIKIKEPAISKAPPLKENKVEDKPYFSEPKQVQLTQRLIIDYWLKEKKWLLACELARAWRWSGLTLPETKNKKTNIPPPRKEALKSLQKIVKNQNFEQQLLTCEQLFLEPGGQYFLDLQWFSWQAANQMKAYPLSDFLLRKTHKVCQAHPELIHLHFSCGLSFANQQTKQWLEKEKIDILKEKAAKTGKALALEQANRQNLSETLKELDKVIPANMLETLHLLQAKAEVCRLNEQKELALIFYQELTDKIEQFNMSLWFPENAVNFWQDVLNFLNCIKPQALSSEQRKLKQEMQKKICLINGSKALACISG